MIESVPIPRASSIFTDRRRLVRWHQLTTKPNASVDPSATAVGVRIALRDVQHENRYVIGLRMSCQETPDISHDCVTDFLG